MVNEHCSAALPTRLVVLPARARSSRWGLRPLTKVGGISLIERVIASARQAGFDQVVVLASGRATEIEPHVLRVSRRRGVAASVVSLDRRKRPIALSSPEANGAQHEDPVAVVPANHVFSPSLLLRLRQTPVEPNEFALAVDTLPGSPRAPYRRDALHVSVADGHIRAIGHDLPAFEPIAVGAFVCGRDLLGVIETMASVDHYDFAESFGTLLGARVARAVPIAREDWWFEVESGRTRRHATRFLLRAAAKPDDGTIAVRLNGILARRLVTPALIALFGPIRPNHVSLLAFAVACAAGAAFALGAPIQAGLLVALTAVLDRSDGEIARLTLRPSDYGGFLDAVLDRAADGVLFTGAAIYLATDLRVGSFVGTSQVPLAISVGGAALLCHLLVSYTTAKAAVDLGHAYHGTLLGGGRGRDRRLLLVTGGALGAAIEPIALMIALAAVAGLGAWIVIVRLRRSWWVLSPGAPYLGVRAVVLDFDGTVADSMEFLTTVAARLLVEELGLDRSERRYLATSGADFRAQLDELAPGHAALARVADIFETEKSRWIGHCKVFRDVLPAVDRLVAAGIPVLVCSSTRESLVRDFCDRNGLLERLTSVDGWAPERDKSAQLAAAVATADVPAHDVMFVGDSCRDADVARAAGTRFVGLVREGRPDAFAGTGSVVVGSLTDLAVSAVGATRVAVTRQRPLPRAPDGPSGTGLTGEE